MSKRKNNTSQNTNATDNEQIESVESELDQRAEELVDEVTDEQDQQGIDEKIDEIVNEGNDDLVDTDEQREEAENMNQQIEQDQGFDQEPKPVAANGSNGSGKASAALAMSLLALAGTGYNWYDAKSSKSSQSEAGEQVAVDYSSQIQNLEQQMQSLTESQEKLASMSSATESTVEGVDEEAASDTVAEAEAVEEVAETTQTATQEGDVEQTAMTEEADVTETIPDSSEVGEPLAEETDEQPTTEEATEAQTASEETQDSTTETSTEQVAEAEAADVEEQPMSVATAPSNDEIKQIAMQEVDAVLTEAKKRLSLNEVAQLLSIGEQRLALAGDVAGAKTAFGIANERLSAFSDPLVDPLRESVTANIDSLNAVEVVDKAALTEDLGNIAGAVDTLAFKPLETLADDPPAEEVSEETVAETESDTELSLEGAGNLLRSWGSKIGSTIGDVGSGIADDLKDMVRIKKTGPLSDVVLAPEQEYFIRENMKLMLGGAQRAVLQNNGGIYQQNIIQAQSLLGEFFDANNEDVQSVAGRLADLAKINLEPELPDISGSSVSLAEVLKQFSSADSSAN